jgi:hypothetical protein
MLCSRPLPGPGARFAIIAGLSSNFFIQFFHSIHYSMENNVKKNRQWYFSMAIVLLIPIVFGFTNPIVPESTCPGPQISLTSQSSGAASFSWNAVSGATEYVVFYVRQGDNYTSPLTHTQSTSFAYSGLPSGKYNFCFATVCENGLSQIIIIEDLVI